MNTKLISILVVALGVTTANAAETKVSGEFFGNLSYELDNGETAGTDNATGYGFTTERARVGVMHSVNDTWSVTLEVDGAGAAAFSKAHVTAKNWLSDGHTMHFGKQQNAYSRMWETMNARWIHSDLTTANAGSVYGAGAHLADVDGVSHLGDFSGLNYNIAFNDMWQLEVSLNNGQSSDFENTAGDAGNADSFGYGLTLMGKFSDQLALLVGYDNAQDFSGDGLDDDTDVSGANVVRASLFYMSDMIDAGFEYAAWDYNEDDSVVTTEDGVGAMALHANWKYAENRGAFLKYTQYDSDFEDNIGLENAYTLGHTWTLDKGVNTGVFYTASSAVNSDNDTSAIQWKWGASF